MVLTMSNQVQSVIDRYVKSMRSVRGLFDLYPDPRPQGRPARKYAPLPPAIVQGATAAFEAFAEDLLVVALMNYSTSWAQVSHHADLTNPSLTELSERLDSTCGVQISPGSSWKLTIWRQSGKNGTAWIFSKKQSWGDVMRSSQSWIQVRHCLTHGITTGTEPSKWSDPVKSKASNQGKLPVATEVLAEYGGSGKYSLGIYPAINCCRVFSEGAAVAAAGVGAALNEKADISKLAGMFDSI